MVTDIESIFLVEWELLDEIDKPSYEGVSILGTHLYRDKEPLNERCYCKHCRRMFKFGDEKSVAVHMRNVHPQVDAQMTFEQYVSTFHPKYQPHGHGTEVTMEKSFSIGLRKFVLCPERCSEVLRYDNVATIINDKFPKSEFHLLILPRAHHVSRADPKTMDAIKPKIEWHIEWCKDYIWKMFTKKFSFVVQMTKEEFFDTFIDVGVHYVPSMLNAHIHVITKDFHSDFLKNKKHFNSFNGPFFIKWQYLPMNKELCEKSVLKEFIKNKDMICPYCHVSFGNRFSILKSHLDEEFNRRFIDRSS